MTAAYYLLLCMVAVGQPAPAKESEWLVVPRLNRGQELLYKGTYTEESLGSGVHSSRSYRLETRVFVLDSRSLGADVAFFTLLKLHKGKLEQVGDELRSDPSSVRLESGRVDLQGRVTANAGSALALPLDGPPTIEAGVFVEMLRGRVAIDQTWEAAEADRPPREWKVLAVEAVNSSRCLKLVGVQKSEDWDKPRGDRGAWRRQDTVWLALATGYAHQVERVIERRGPARKEPDFRSSTSFKLDTSIQYPGQLYEDRRTEIQRAQAIAETLAPLLPKAGQVGPKPFEALLSKINHHLENQPATPYREFVLQLKRRAEAGKKGETPPSLPGEHASPVGRIIALGNEAPDFAATDLALKETTRLRRFLGQPIVLVFYKPSSNTVEEVLPFAQKLADDYRGKATVLAMAMTDDVEATLKQRKRMKLTIAVLAGLGLRHSYAVEATPKLVVLDGTGVVRGAYDGWGPETPQSIVEDLKKCLQK